MNRKLWDKVEADILHIASKYAAYQSENSHPNVPDHKETLKMMSSAVEKMAIAMGSKPSSLERLTVPIWDGSRRTYQKWKREFRHCMAKYGQDKEEQLQRFRKAMPKDFFWTDQVKTCKDVDQDWEILKNEFANERKLMDERLAEMNNLKQVKRYFKSLTRCATTISVFVNDMKDSGCIVLKVSEAPFFMSQLLSKLDQRDNTNFGREMQRAGKEENVGSVLVYRFTRELPLFFLCSGVIGGEKKSEASEIIEINITSTIEEDIRKTLEAYAIKKPCSAATTISKGTIEHFPHLKPAANKLHLSGGTIDLLIGTDFVDAFVDIHTLSGEPREPIARCNCFGWYVLRQVNSYRIQSVAVGTVSIEDDFKKLLYQDTLGVKPTELCICSENVLRENKFVKSLSDSTTLVYGRIQVRMPWNENGPPERSNYDIALKIMQSAEKSFQRTGCFEIVNDEVQKLLQQDLIIKVPTEKVDHSQPEWYMPLQAVLPPEKTTERSDKTETPSVSQWLRLNFNDKPAPDIASNAINYLAKVSQVEFPDAAQEPRDNVYVDDIAGSKSNSTEARKITKEIDTILGKGKFQVKAWHSNCSEIDQSRGERFTDLLGHKWDREEDNFTFKKEKAFDRKLKPSNAVGVLQSHGFSDGGEQAYGAVIFQRWTPTGGD
ncbi:hypothetical protein AWC38_SpisGene22761 [Stylophora pistillata]|uniref:Uncharacterized protein n=1 Tax=Stylophora pistillata TaxID=50429 RepID=A0A2B4RAC2_STYPI|nr:hypothetical protein AWC38_SpisGene22761 [Stylophora pistillata]